MKNKLVKTCCLLLLFLSTHFLGSAQVYVKVRPVAPVILKTDILAAGYIWVNEEWEQYDGNYRYSGCRWMAARKSYKWRPGHWKRHRRYGEQWIQGRWM